MEFALIAFLAIAFSVVGAILAAVFFFRMVTHEPPKRGKRRKIE